MRTWIIVFLLVIGGCSGGGDKADKSSEDKTFLDTWAEVPAGPDYEGHATRVDEDQRVLYIDDCGLARQATSDGEPFDGYAYLCP